MIKTQLRVVFNDELKREDFLKALVSSKNSRGINIILNAFVIFKGMGCSHSVFHRTPPYSRIQYSKRNNNLKMIDCFCCIDFINTKYGFNKDLGFDHESYENYIEELQNEKDSFSIKKKEN